jgi:hypothetical protein
MSEYPEENIFAEPKSSSTLKMVALLAAVAVTAIVFIGYGAIRRQHAEKEAARLEAAQPKVEPRPEPKALVLVDDAMLKAGTITLGGMVKNTSNEELGPLAVELELKKRTGGGVETRLVNLQPANLKPQEEGRYSLQLKANEFGTARVIALRTASGSTSIAYTTAQGQKRPSERLESKTIVVDKPRGQGTGEFLNTPDNPARVP